MLHFFLLKNTYRLQTRTLLISLGLLFITACSESAKYQKFQLHGTTMGTLYHITVIATNKENSHLNALQTEIDTLLKLTNQQMSTYLPTSEISQFNQYDKTDWFSVSTQLAHVVDYSQQVSALSNGAFDITAGTLVNLWGFGSSYQEKIPSAQEIDTVLQHTGYHLLDNQFSPASLKKTNPQVTIDLSAIAKGYAVDQLSQLLINHGYKNHLVEIGGELRVHGKNIDAPWKVGINIPYTLDKVYEKPLMLTDNEGVATSGGYNNYFTKSGKQYSHTIDPKTGKPITHNLSSVTVVADSTMEADALATALMVMGNEKGRQFVQDNKLKVFMVIKKGDDTFTTWNTFGANF